MGKRRGADIESSEEGDGFRSQGGEIGKEFGRD